MKKISVILMMVFVLTGTIYGQQKQSIAVLGIESKNLDYDFESITDLVRIELEKTNVYEVMDKYDMKDFIKEKNIEICYGKTRLIDAGKTLNVDNMLTGSIVKLGGKIIISFRLIDVNKAIVKKSEISEYVDMPDYIQNMVGVSINNILDRPNDPNVVNRLSVTNTLLNIPQETLKLTGPRIGVAYISGDFGDRLQASIGDGGWDAYPVMTQFGYQFETQYISTGNFQALVEYLIMFSGMAQGMFVPSLVLANGFRSNKTGWEIAFGPSFTLKRISEGFYDDKNFLNEGAGKWLPKSRFDEIDPNDRVEEGYEIEERVDKNGDIEFGAGWVWSIGKTFKSGNLNIPLNLYASPKKSGGYYGASVGFNLNKSYKK
ncbi:MAG: hypothetical protein U9R42_07420 [Bacteroidota bacterium]|nr:hypothetical protein [Bacteroidota bacterium]